MFKEYEKAAKADVHDATFTDMMFCSVVTDLLADKGWALTEDTGDEITLKPTMLSQYRGSDGMNETFCLRLPHAITEDWLAGIITVSAKAAEEHPFLTPEYIAHQYIENGLLSMLIPVQKIKILALKEMREKFPELSEAMCGWIFGRAVPEERTVYMGVSDFQFIQYTPELDFWNILCHEIRHLGIGCNPIFPKEYNEEESVFEFGKNCSLYYPWDRSNFIELDSEKKDGILEFPMGTYDTNKYREIMDRVAAEK